MNDHEKLLERIGECINQESGCGLCGYSDYGCSRSRLMSAVIEALSGYVHPESSGLYDLEEIHENVTVQVWKNSVTGEVSVGWYENGVEED